MFLTCLIKFHQSHKLYCMNTHSSAQTQLLRLHVQNFQHFINEKTSILQSISYKWSLNLPRASGFYWIINTLDVWTDIKFKISPDDTSWPQHSREPDVWTGTRSAEVMKSRLFPEPDSFCVVFSMQKIFVMKV